MQAKVTWDKDLQFIGVADSGYAVRMDSSSGPGSGVGPVEMTLLALAGCTAMDVISIMTKKKESVDSFHVDVEADRASTYPKVITRARLKYVVTGDRISEASLLRAIDLSVKQYCPVHAMLKKAFPIAIEYSIFEPGGEAGSLPVKNGFYEPDAGTP